MKRYIFTLLIFVIWNTGYSQRKKNKDSDSEIPRLKILRYEENAEKSFAANNFKKALIDYMIVDSLVPGRPEIQYNIGVCYLNSNFKYKALPYLVFAKQKKVENADLNYMLGQAYHHNHKFEQARQAFKEYWAALKKNTTDDVTDAIADVERRIQICDFAKEIYADSIPVSIENIGDGINSEFDEYLPIVSADQQVIYFTSRRKSEFSSRIAADGKYFEDIYYSEKDTSTGKWGEAKLVESPLNSPEHDASIAMTADAQTIYIFRVRSSDIEKGHVYMSKLSGNTWKKPTILGSNINYKGASSTSLCITSDNHRLYFSSEREGGLGGSDIWYSDLTPDNEWGEAKNAGPAINTLYDEDSPFMHTDGKTLFFSSEGHNTMGGYDVFSTVMNADGTWAKPRNMGYPINTTDDDLFFVYSADGSKGYLASSLRPDNRGERDIYVVSRPGNSKKMIVMNGNIKDDESNKPVEATITVTNLENNEVVGVFNSNSKDGKYVLAMEYGKNYSVQFEADGFLFHSENVNVDNAEAIFSENKSFVLRHIKPGNTLTLNNIFFDFNQYTLKTESLPELDKLLDFMQKHPHVFIQVAGHTDSIGSDSANLRVSKKRAFAVVDYLIARGIPEKNLSIAGYGETKPVAKNSTEEGRKMNRRTECYIYNMDSLSKKQVFHMSKMDTTTDDNLILQELAPKKQVGQVLYPSVHFLYNNGAYLTEFSKTEIEKVCDALKRVPSLKLEIGGSTDVVGAEYNNKFLYEQRVHTVLQLFAEHGFAADRFTIKPFEPVKTAKVWDLKQGNMEKRKVSFTLAAF